ncbi:MAG: hypothetical protein U9Q34_08315 [Elusimicrobiota bacterium]|nr:hypothetical protein [Elusimicrobiota bacterium]
MRISILLIAFFIFGGCFSKANLKNAGETANEAVVLKSENYILADSVDYNSIADFNENILKAYKKTISNIDTADFQAGFVYKIIPKGIVNPFSKVEVACLVQNKYSGKFGIKLCNKFFKNIEKEFKRK